MDVLMPVMATQANKSDAAKTLWVKYMRKMMMEDSSGIVQWTSIWQLVVRHSKLFYPLR